MAAEFNLNSFLGEYQSYNNRQYTAAENGKAAMEERDIERAREATQSVGFLGLTLSEKMSELGVGSRVIEQIGDTAKGMVTGIVSPFTEWLEKYEKVFDAIYGNDGTNPVSDEDLKNYFCENFISSSYITKSAAE